MDRRQSIRMAGMVTGAVVGLGVGAFQAVMQFGYGDGLTVGQNIAAFAPTAMACVAVSVFSTLALFELFQSVPMHPILGIPVGAGAGFVEGALIGGVTYGLFFGLAEALDPGFASASTWWHAVAQGAFGGGIFGGLIGLAPGAAAGLTITLIARR